MRARLVSLMFLALVGCAAAPKGVCAPNTVNPSFAVDLPRGWDATIPGGFSDPHHVVFHDSDIEGRLIVDVHMTPQEADGMVAEMVPLLKEHGWTIVDASDPTFIIASHGTQRRAIRSVKVASCSASCAPKCQAFVDMQTDQAGFTFAFDAVDTMEERITLR